jgi:cellulose biosynthesis protein BcsQ
MVDLDPQAGLTTSIGRDPGSFGKTIYNILIDDQSPIKEVIVETKVTRLWHFSIFGVDMAGIFL